MTDPSSSSSTMDSPLAHAKSFIALLLNHPSYSTYDALFLRHLRLTSATLLSPTATVTARLTVIPEMCNAMGNLHGGATATIFDLVTTLGIVVAASRRRRQSSSERDGSAGGAGEGSASWVTAGVSRTLNVAYLEGVGVGEEVEVVAEVVKMGKRLAHVRGVMRKVGGGEEGNGRVVATAEHGKVNVDRPVESEEVKKVGEGKRENQSKL